MVRLVFRYRDEYEAREEVVPTALVYRKKGVKNESPGFKISCGFFSIFLISLWFVLYHLPFRYRDDNEAREEVFSNRLGTSRRSVKTIFTGFTILDFFLVF